jgi:hypothetical protein
MFSMLIGEEHLKEHEMRRLVEDSFGDVALKTTGN